MESPEVEAITGVDGVGPLFAASFGLVFGLLFGFACLVGLAEMIGLVCAAALGLAVWVFSTVACVVLLRARQWRLRFDDDALVLVGTTSTRRVPYAHVRFVDAESRGLTWGQKEPRVLRVRIHHGRRRVLRIAFVPATASQVARMLRVKCPAAAGVDTDGTDWTAADPATRAASERALAGHWRRRAALGLGFGSFWAAGVILMVWTLWMDSPSSGEKLQAASGLAMVLAAVPFATDRTARGLRALRRLLRR